MAELKSNFLAELSIPRFLLAMALAVYFGASMIFAACNTEDTKAPSVSSSDADPTVLTVDQQITIGDINADDPIKKLSASNPWLTFWR